MKYILNIYSELYFLTFSVTKRVDWSLTVSMYLSTFTAIILLQLDCNYLIRE